MSAGRQRGVLTAVIGGQRVPACPADGQLARADPADRSAGNQRVSADSAESAGGQRNQRVPILGAGDIRIEAQKSGKTGRSVATHVARVNHLQEVARNHSRVARRGAV